jgi:hypothetical protein
MQPIDSSRAYAARFKAVFLILVVFLILYGSLSLYNYVKFHVITTNPTISKIGAQSPYLKVYFNKTLSNQSLVVSATGNAMKSDSVSGKVLTVNFNEPLTINKSYTVIIHSISSQSGSQILNKNFTFTAQNIPFNDLPTDQQKALVGSQDHFQAAQKDPILVDLPYSTLYFILNPSFGTDKTTGKISLVLQAQLLLAPGVTGDQATADEAQYKQEVISYIESLGLNPANYNIQYQVVNETLNGP